MLAAARAFVMSEQAIREADFVETEFYEDGVCILSIEGFHDRLVLMKEYAYSMGGFESQDNSLTTAMFIGGPEWTAIAPYESVRIGIALDDVVVYGQKKSELVRGSVVILSENVKYWFGPTDSVRVFLVFGGERCWANDVEGYLIRPNFKG
jgi:hypothetical protein